MAETRRDGGRKGRLEWQNLKAKGDEVGQTNKNRIEVGIGRKEWRPCNNHPGNLR